MTTGRFSLGQIMVKATSDPGVPELVLRATCKLGKNPLSTHCFSGRLIIGLTAQDLWIYRIPCGNRPLRFDCFKSWLASNNLFFALSRYVNVEYSISPHQYAVHVHSRLVSSHICDIHDSFTYLAKFKGALTHKLLRLSRPFTT